MDGDKSKSLTRLLVVDDEQPQLQALSNTLRDEGYEVTSASDGAAALVALRHNSFDVMLTDLRMPDMDGIALLEASQKIDPNLVCIVMTGFAAVETAVEAMKQGALDYIQKPFKLSSVLSVLGRALLIRNLRREKEALEEQVQKHTHELEVANQELEAFSYSVSHDLRAPLMSIIGHVDVLLEDCQALIPANAQKSLGAIRNASQRMSSLIEDLLELSHVSRHEMFTHQVDVSALVRLVVDDIRAQYPNSKADVVMTDMLSCHGDESLLRQVFTNLIGNAFKYSRRVAAPRVEIGSRSTADGTEYFVKDNGAGFDSRYANKLFTVFGRLHAATQFEGTGVGLSIVQRIVDRHRGRTWAEGAVNEGATFSFFLPKES
jgi:signal transduction histidine kinase